MSKETGYKGISYKVEDGERVGYKVFVQWRKRIRSTTVRFLATGSTSGALDEVLTIRHQFERELRKPRSERQISTAGKGIRVLRSEHLVIAQLGRRKAKSFGYKHIGLVAALTKARKVRRAAGFP